MYRFSSEDAEKLRQHAVSESGDMDSLEKMIDDSSESSDAEDSSNDESSSWYEWLVCDDD